MTIIHLALIGHLRRKQSKIDKNWLSFRYFCKQLKNDLLISMLVSDLLMYSTFSPRVQGKLHIDLVLIDAQSLKLYWIG